VGSISPIGTAGLIFQNDRAYDTAQITSPVAGTVIQLLLGAAMPLLYYMGGRKKPPSPRMPPPPTNTATNL
jgi:hypothetical protein